MEEDLLGDLVEYRKSRDKGVITASRGILQLYREQNPGMLKKRERVSLTNLSVNPYPNRLFMSQGQRSKYDQKGYRTITIRPYPKCGSEY